MATDIVSTRTSELAEDAWTRWEREHAEVLERATAPQRVLLEAAVRFMAVIAAQPILLRVVAFFLLHAGVGLTPTQVGAAVGRTDRAMRTVRSLGVREVLDSIWAELGRHRQPKLHAEHVWDALRKLGARLPPAFHLAHPGTLRRWLLMRDADLIVTTSHLLVVLAFDPRRPWLRPLVQQFNETEVTLPWLGSRRVLMGFAPGPSRYQTLGPC